MENMYGKMKSEKMATENLACRGIVKEIINFGVTQRQMLMIMFYLAMELENNEQMLEITALIRELTKGSESFLIDLAEEGTNG
jgi:hypothetical protein